jgi:hypothetical protein
MAREIAAIGAVPASGTAPMPPPREAPPPVVAVRAPSRDVVELSARVVSVPGPATGGQQQTPKLQLPPEELRARVSR